MADTTLGTAYVQIRPTAQGISGAISETLGGEAEKAGTSAGSKIGVFAKKALAKKPDKSTALHIDESKVRSKGKNAPEIELHIDKNLGKKR